MAKSAKKAAKKEAARAGRTLAGRVLANPKSSAKDKKLAAGACCLKPLRASNPSRLRALNHRRLGAEFSPHAPPSPRAADAGTVITLRLAPRPGKPFWQSA
jgi:hypothetical protein